LKDVAGESFVALAARRATDAGPVPTGFGGLQPASESRQPPCLRGGKRLARRWPESHLPFFDSLESRSFQKRSAATPACTPCALSPGTRQRSRHASALILAAICFGSAATLLSAFGLTGQADVGLGALILRRPSVPVARALFLRRGAFLWAGETARCNRVRPTDRRIRRLRAPPRLSSQGIANSLIQRGAEFMRCYFLRTGRIAGVEILPLGLSDEDTIARAHTLSSKRKGPFDGFEVWDRARFVFRRPPSADTPGVDQPPVPTPDDS
jgi:hypothetical protein